MENRGNIYNVFVLVFGLFCSALGMVAQPNEIHGKVHDKSNGEPIPMANVYFKNTTIGTTSDLDGKFVLHCRKSSDSLIVSALGYTPFAIAYAKCKGELRVKLEPATINMKEVKVKPSDWQVRFLLKKAKENKEINDPDKIERYTYEKYVKWDYTLNNVGKTLMQSNVFKNRQSFFKKMENGNYYLPLYFAEQVTKNEFQKEPLKEKTTTIAENISGLGVMDHLEVGGYTSALEADLNFYNNFIKLYGRNFVSPMSSNGWFYYRYYLTDSSTVDDHTNYKILFYPRRKGENVFQGYMVIEDRQYSLVEMDMKLTEGNQLNFLKALSVNCTYQMVEGSKPFLKTNDVSAQFDYLPTHFGSGKQHIELGYKRSCSISKVKTTHIDEIKLTTKGLSYESIKVNDAKSKDSLFWEGHRQLELSLDDKTKFAIIDSVNNINQVKVVNNTVEMGLTGFYDFGKYELGPYPDLFKFNKIEGARFYFGGRTSSEISENWMFYGGVGYGLKNKKVSGQVGVGYKFNSIRRKVLKFSYDDRYFRMGENRQILYLKENMIKASETNLVSSLFNRDEFDELNRMQHVQMSYAHEWRTGIVTSITSNYAKQYSPEFYPFQYKGQPVNDLNIAEAKINLRLSWREKFVDSGFRRLYLSSNFPIINMSVSGGHVEFNGNEEVFMKLHSSLKSSFFMGQTEVKYAIEAGHIIGTLPYTLLNMPRGNETYGYYLYNFNMINYLEFVHDSYLHSYWEYHLNGFIFNRFPLLKHLGFREVFSAKTMLGYLSEKQHSSIDMPEGMRGLSEPYAEIGAGVENVFRLFRVEALWRPVSSAFNVPEFCIRVRVEIKL